MTPQNLRPSNVVAAGVLIGGLLIVFLPHHVFNIAAVILALVAAAVALHLLVSALGLSEGSWWPRRSPFATVQTSAAPRPLPQELERMRSMLSRSRRQVVGRPALPSSLESILARLLMTALERHHVDLSDPAQREQVRAAVSPEAFSLVRGPKKDDGGAIASGKQLPRNLPSDEAEVAKVVHKICDDLERLATDGIGTTR